MDHVLQEWVITRINLETEVEQVWGSWVSTHSRYSDFAPTMDEDQQFRPSRCRAPRYQMQFRIALLTLVARLTRLHIALEGLCRDTTTEGTWVFRFGGRRAVLLGARLR